MKKRKTPKGRKRKKSRHSSTPVVPPTRKIPWLLIFGLVVCAIIVSVFLRGFLSPAGDKAKEKKQSSDSLESKAAISKLTPEEEIAALKKEEMELAQQVLTDFPNNDGACMLMGDLSARHGDSVEAVKYWEKSLEINPRHFDAWRNMGRIALEKEQLDRAVTLLRKALEIKPGAADLRRDIAKALMDSGQYDEAITELEQEIKISPSSFTAHFQLAEAYRQQKEYDKAIEHYEKTIRLESEHRHAHYGLGMVYTRMGQREKAREHLVIFQELRDKVDSIYSKRQVGSREYLVALRESVVKTYLDAESLYRNSGNTAKAEALLKRAYALEPDNTRCLERLAFLYYTTRRTPQALECFERVARIDPNNPMTYLNIGKVSTQLRMFEKAERAFRTTIALAPNAPVGYCELARFYLRTNTNVAQAHRLAQQAMTLEKNAETYFLLGWAADMNGDRLGALQAMEEAIKLEPQNQQYRKIYEGIKAKN